MKKIGYLGPMGTFAHEATLGYVRESLSVTQDSDIELKPYPTKLDVLEAVDSKEIDQGVVPIENSIEGSVTETLDGLSRFDDLVVTTELVLPISQNLMALPSATVEKLSEVWSHPQGIAQCRGWLHERHLAAVEFSSTAAAAKAVRDSGRSDVAAIANRAAASVFGLNILKPDLEDEKENRTRFVVVLKDEKKLTISAKTMLLITPSKEESGVLAAMLNVLAALSLNLTWIESRPTRRRLGTYQFFIDVESKDNSEILEKAITILRTLGHQVRVLGSYQSIAL